MSSRKPISLAEVQPLFSMPLREAAEILGISTTHLKTACRKLGIAKWPFRQVKAFGPSASEFVVPTTRLAWPSNLQYIDEGVKAECRDETPNTTKPQHVIKSQEQMVDIEQEPRQHQRKSRRGLKNVTKEEIEQHFNLPLKSAADEIGISTTYLKGLCRKFDIPRWPYRQVKAFGPSEIWLPSAPKRAHDAERIPQMSITRLCHAESQRHHDLQCTGSDVEPPSNSNPRV